jgi:serine/threonine protein kinase
MKEVFIEKCILKMLDHPSIIKLYHSFACNGRFYLLIEFCYNGSLLAFIERQRTLSL